MPNKQGRANDGQKSAESGRSLATRPLEGSSSLGHNLAKNVDAAIKSESHSPALADKGPPATHQKCQ